MASHAGCFIYFRRGNNTTETFLVSDPYHSIMSFIVHSGVHHAPCALQKLHALGKLSRSKVSGAQNVFSAEISSALQCVRR